MLLAIGFLLLLIGFLTLFFGDRHVGGQGGWLMRGVSWPAGKARWLKIPMGLALIVAGALVLIRALGI